MVIVFDLDDTLYEEITFVHSGFRAVAKWLELQAQHSSEEFYEELIRVLTAKGRGFVFNEVLIKYGIYSRFNLIKCVNIYRSHNPEISLTREAVQCLKRFEGVPKYIVTDGNKIVQANKVKALKLEQSGAFKKIFITYRHGLKHSKPSPYCFDKICMLEKTNPQFVHYIGDNPNKDFIGIKPLGYKTVRVLQGQYANVKLGDQYEAHIKIGSLNELTVDLLTSLRTDKTT